MNRRSFHRGACAAGLVFPSRTGHSRQNAGWSFRASGDRVEIRRDDAPIATYVTRHPKILRPFFQDLYTPGQRRITRPIPPDPAREDADHDTMHPGLWLAFGQLEGLDYWRNKAPVRHARFVEPPTVENDVLRFRTENHWLDAAGAEIVCREIARFRFSSIGPDAVLDWSSEFLTDRPALRFGHQEEMGLGLRLTRSMTVKHGAGRIDASNGGIDEKGTWGKSAQWWAASVPAEKRDPAGLNRRTGIQILARFEPGNRPFWGHTRDYGLIVANPSPPPGSTMGEFAVASQTPPNLHFRIRSFDSASPDFAFWAEHHPIVIEDRPRGE